MKSFVAGLSLGLGVGIVIAPAAGRETRKRFAQKAADAAEKLLRLEQSGQSPAATGNEMRPATIVSNGDGAAAVQQDQKREIKFDRDGAAQDGAAQDKVVEVLNTASKTKLRKVKGIGESKARRIIEHRPYQSGDELLQDKTLSEETLEKLKDTLAEGDEEVA